VTAAYLDASVLTRIILNEPSALAEWSSLDAGVASALARVECYRALERLWRQHQLTDEELEFKRLRLDTLLRNLELIPIEDAVLNLASQPFATWVASLDAIHLSTAMIYRRRQPEDERPIVFATHDRQLAKAAAAMQFDVIGATA
jgi:predicted nucleic acid-binding protein